MFAEGEVFVPRTLCILSRFAFHRKLRQFQVQLSGELRPDSIPSRGQ